MEVDANLKITIWVNLIFEQVLYVGRSSEDIKFSVISLLVELFVADIENSNDIEERLSTCIMIRPRVTGGSEVRPILKQ